MKAQELIESVIDKNREREHLLTELSESLLLESVWPGVFEHGKVQARISGNFAAIHTLRLLVEDGAGTVREFELKDVPKELIRKQLARVPDGLWPRTFTGKEKRMRKIADMGKEL